jgi:hypothetical protein
VFERQPEAPMTSTSTMTLKSTANSIGSFGSLAVAHGHSLSDCEIAELVVAHDADPVP